MYKFKIITLIFFAVFLIGFQPADADVEDYLQAKAYRSQKDYKQAAKAFEELIKADPSQRLSYYYLGEALFERGRYEQAYQYLSKAHAFYPDNQKVNLLLGRAKNKLGKGFFAEEKKEKDKKRRSVRLQAYQPKLDVPVLEVSLLSDIREFTFSCGAIFRATDGQSAYEGSPNKFYRLYRKKNGFGLAKAGDNVELISFKNRPRISSTLKDKKSHPFYILSVLSGSDNFWHRRLDRKYRGALEVRFCGDKLRLINIVSIEEYLYGVLPSEILPSSPNEALYAQAIAARTLALGPARHRGQGFDFCADVHCQVYKGLSAENPATNRAVDKTYGEILVYKGEPIEVFYHSHCGGCLSDDVFGQLPYLENKSDIYCIDSGGAAFRWQRAYDAEDFEFVFGFPLKSLKEINITEEGSCRRIKEIELITSGGKKSIRGGLKIRDYFDKLRSSLFEVELRPGPLLVFSGFGFGHGSGMCQAGAMQMGREGKSYRQILKHYYPGAEIEKAY